MSSPTPSRTPSSRTRPPSFSKGGLSSVFEGLRVYGIDRVVIRRYPVVPQKQNLLGYKIYNPLNLILDLKTKENLLIFYTFMT